MPGLKQIKTLYRNTVYGYEAEAYYYDTTAKHKLYIKITASSKKAAETKLYDTLIKIYGTKIICNAIKEEKT